jgi:hypothetical protein
MRFLFTVLLCLPPLIGKSQKNPKITSYKTQKGIEMKIGDTLQLGRGSNSMGNFNHLKTGLFIEPTVNDPLPSTHANARVIIRSFREFTAEHGTKMLAMIKARTAMPAYADIEAAIDTKEITGINNWQIGTPRTKQQSIASSSLTASSHTITESTPTQDRMMVKPFSNTVDIRILSIEGNKSQQTVTVNFVLKTELPHQHIGLIQNVCGTYSDGKAYDGDGSEYNKGQVALGNNISQVYVDNKLPTSVPLKGSITFSNVLPRVSAFSFVTFYMSSRNFDGGANCQGGNVEIRNAPIMWK